MTSDDAISRENSQADKTPSAVPDGTALFAEDGLVGSRKVKLLAAEFYFNNSDGAQLGVARQKVWSKRQDFRFYSPDGEEELLAVTSRTFFRPNVYDVIAPDGQTCGVLRRRRTTGMFEQPPWEIFSPDQRALADVEQQGKVIKIRNGDLVLGIASFSIGGTFEMQFTPDTTENLPRPLGVAAMLVLMAIHHGVVA